MSNNVVGGDNSSNSSNNSSPFSRSSGKRVVKPSFKLQESPLFTTNISNSKPDTPAAAGAKNDINKEKVENDVNIPEEKPIIRQSKLVLNEKLLEKLRKPSQQVKENF